MDEADDRYPNGYEIGDFMVFYEIFERVAESAPLKPWHGGVRAGFYSPLISHSSTTSAYWLDEAWLVEALDTVRERRMDTGDDGGSDTDKSGDS